MQRTSVLLKPRIYIRLWVVSLIIFLSATVSAWASGQRDGVSADDVKGADASKPGVYFYRLEPSFYTGFAPRCQDPRRIHTYLGRGNQLRVTVVLSDQIIDEYLPDLAARYKVYRELIDKGQIVLSQNMAFERFEEVILEEGILNLAGQKERMDPQAYRKLSLEKLRELNPGRVFHINIDFKRRIKEWSAQLAGTGEAKRSLEDRLDIINEMLPTRMKVSELSAETGKSLNAVFREYARYESKRGQTAWDRFYHAAMDLFAVATGGIYPIRNDTLDYHEFTAIYPVGTFNEYAKFDGVKIPLFPYPGKRILRIHQRTRVVDHIPEAACYGYLPWIPYMHVGKRLHNSFHSLWFNIDTRRDSFIPAAWRRNTANSRTGKPYPHLWLVSRGPMSHGCTHVNAGHISELRQLLPSSEAVLREVVTYRSKSHHFDVFDIDGDGRLEVMGVKYFYAYSLKNKKPHRMRTASDRRSFYAWLYQKGYRYDGQGRVIFEHARASKFIGKKAVEGKTHTNIPLYEAENVPETIQFYKPKGIPFVRELRRVSSTYGFDRRVLNLR